MNTKVENQLSTPAFSMFHSLGRYGSFYLPFFWNIFEENLLVIFHVSSQSRLQLCLGFPDPFPALPGHTPMVFPGSLSLPRLSIHFDFVLYFGYVLI